MYGRYICLWKVLILFSPNIWLLTYQRYTHSYSHSYPHSLSCDSPLNTTLMRYEIMNNPHPVENDCENKKSGLKTSFFCGEHDLKAVYNAVNSLKTFCG